MVRKSRRKKPSPRRSSRRMARRGAARGRARRPRRPWRRALGYGLIALLVIAVGYTVYLDIRLRGRFEGKRWELPAHVYARPLELFPGRDLSAEEFERELGWLRYRAVGNPRRPGTYARQGETFAIATRPFAFWDGREPSVNVRVRFARDRVAAIARPGGAPVTLVRLDPLRIGGIYPDHQEDRILVRLDRVPKALVGGLLAVEDREFFKHPGIDVRAIARALLANLRAGRAVQGGSTLTQQLAKNFFFSNKRSLWRKANETVMALLLEWHYEKDEILEAYLNEVYLGQAGERAIHGFGLASRFYFDAGLEDLRLDQLALLVGLVKGASYYDPRRHPDRARTRRDLVLDIMEQEGVVSSGRAEQARQRPLGVSPKPPPGVTRYPAFVDLVQRQLRRDYREADLTSEGLQIFTTLDPLVQDRAERALIRVSGQVEQPGVKLQGAVVVTQTDSGEVVAVVGGRRPRFAGFNRALDAVRPVGSLIKPAVYLAALSDPERYTLATLLDDAPVEVRLANGETWAPHNYDRSGHGRVPLYAALAHSYNRSTARLGLAVGVEQVRNVLRRLGVQRPVEAYPALVLGAASLAPIDVAQMYQTLADGGFRTPLRSICAVLTAEGKPLSRYPLTVDRAVDPAAAFLVGHALRHAVEEGTGRPLRALLPGGLTVAGKTGTTDELRDSWFAGYTGRYVATVWLGSDGNEPVGLTGATGALAVWGELVRRLHPHPLRPEPPEGITYAWIDPRTGLRTRGDCEGAVELPFVRGSAPQDRAPCRGGGLKWLRRILR